MKGDLRCIEGRLWRHDPQLDDPDLETDMGQTGSLELAPPAIKIYGDTL